MRLRVVAAAAVAVVVILARVLLSTGGSTSAGQPPLAHLENLEALKSEFNRDTSSVRVVLLLSPSCPYCLKGAAEIDRILARYRSKGMVVLAVWQPVLPTDWGLPGTSVLRRLPDARVRHIWDPSHRVATAIEEAFNRRDPQPECCEHRGVWWDLIAVFAPGAQWRDTLPDPLLLNGTVADAAPDFEHLLEK